jgi:hypothetical protein
LWDEFSDQQRLRGQPSTPGSLPLHTGQSSSKNRTLWKISCIIKTNKYQGIYREEILLTSVADPGYFIPDPHVFYPASWIQSQKDFRIRILIFYPSRIQDARVKKAPDPVSATLLLSTYLTYQTGRQTLKNVLDRFGSDAIR